MYLNELLEKLEYTKLQGELKISITNLIYDSRKATKGSVFVCISGAITDGHSYIDDVAKKGAVAIVVERDVEYPEGLTVIKVADTRKALARMSAAYFDYPAEKLTTIGITGTKGKTTTTYMMKAILEAIGIKTGLIGTNEMIIGDRAIPSSHSTPESYVIQETFAKMVDEGCQAVVMEVSSQGLMQSRVEGIEFDYGIFTNLQPDHIGEHEHKDFDDYLYWKSILFQQCKLGILNIDDSHFDEILEGHTCQVETFGFSDEADIRASNVSLIKDAGNLGIAYKVEGLLDFDVEINMPGRFNVYNSLCAIAVCRHFDVSSDGIKEALKDIKVRGRVEIVPVSDKFTVMIDYAHNAMSLESLLKTLREYEPKRLVCLFGCGGNRARDRRFEMGEISSKLADLTIVTSDNPRYEEPQDIINDIIVGVKRGPGKYIEIIDRKEAIRYSLEHAQDGDLIVIAGKGHEDYQEIKGVKHHMDDRELVMEFF